MNILHLSRTMGQGGAEKIVFQLACAEKKKGNHISVASCGGVYTELLEKKDILHHQVCDLECKNPMIILQTLRILEKIIRKERIEILHTHHRMAALYGRLLKIRFPKLKLVYTAHNVFYNKKRLTNISLSDSYIVAVGKNVKKNLIEFFDIKEENIQIIYNAVKIKELGNYEPNTRLENWKKEGFFLVGIIGRLSEQKGVDVFIESIKNIKAQNMKVKGVIIGDGELKEFFENMILEHDLQNDIWMMGYQEHIVTLIQQLDLIAMPSRWEGFPLLPIEVFGAGKTLVANDIGGINEIVQHKNNGILVPKDDIEALSKEIMALMNNRKMRESLEQNAKEYYKKHFCYESFIEQYDSLYQRIL